MAITISDYRPVYTTHDKGTFHFSQLHVREN